MEEYTPEKRAPELKNEINYYVVAAILISIIIFDLVNAVEPQINGQLDFFELSRMLGFAAAWGLILLGRGLNWIADIHYYYSSIYGFDRTSPVHGVWLAGTMIVSYALYKHKKNL